MKTLVLGCGILEAEKLCRRLGEVGIVTETAIDHRDGCGRLLSGSYDVALLDLAQAVPAGIEALRTLRRAGCTTPVICLMARNPAAATRVACLDAGADAFLVRPLEYDVLRAKMDAVHRRNIAPNGLQTLRFADLVVEPQMQSVQRKTKDSPDHLGIPSVDLFHAISKPHCHAGHVGGTGLAAAACVLEYATRPHPRPAQKDQRRRRKAIDSRRQGHGVCVGVAFTYRILVNSHTTITKTEKSPNTQ